MNYHVLKKVHEFLLVSQEICPIDLVVSVNKLQCRLQYNQHVAYASVIMQIILHQIVMALKLCTVHIEYLSVLV
jgi:hypothetical protein